MINHLDLFSGIGGFSLAAQRVWGNEHNIAAFCENDKFCQKVLRKHWPDVPVIERIEDYSYEDKTKTINLLTGGWPCQPFSVAGKRNGRKDDRYLWHEMFRIIKETNPDWIVGENVAGIINMELDSVLSDLEGEGYETQTFIIPACAVNARHRRDRIWITANSNRMGRNEGAGKGIQPEKQKPERQEPEHICKSVPHTKRCSKPHGKNKSIWPVEPSVGRVANGVPNRVDRLKSLGNSIVPQVAEVIMQYIKEINDQI